MTRIYRCGWCITDDCDRCKPRVEFEGRVWDCACTHERRLVTQAEWLGYHVDVEGRPE